MHWDAYTVFSVISGVVLVLMGLAARRLSVKDRVYAFIGGAFFVGYGFYVAKQTTGTYFFSVAVFIVPVVAIGYLVAAAVGANKPRPTGPAPGPSAARPPHGSTAAAAAPASPVTQAAAPPLAERTPAWAAPPAQPLAAQPVPPRLLSAPALTGRIYCTQCGTQGVPGGSFCGECGARMVTGPGG